MYSRRLTLGVVCMATAMLMLDIAVVNTALAHIARSLHAGLSGVQWVVDAYTLALAAAVLTAGSLNDRFGRKRSLVIGLVLFTASSAVCATAGTITVLDAARAVQGIGAAAMFASTLAVVADAFPTPEERAGAFAAFGATIGGAFALGPLVGGALTSGLNWRAIFFLNVPLGVACLAATAVGVRESRTPIHDEWTSPAKRCSPPACSPSCSACCGATPTAGARPGSSSSSSPPRCSSSGSSPLSSCGPTR